MQLMNSKKTALFDTHIGLDAKMVDFAGFMMPVQYANIKEEHHTVRNSVGLFDVSHMGEFIIKGKEALNLVQKISSNDASKLEIGQAQYSCIPNEDGGIVDDMLVYRLSEDQCSEGEQAFMLVVNASNIDKDWDWISKYNDFDTKMINISDQTGLLALQGPKAKDTLQKLTEIDLSNIPYYSFTKGSIAGIDNIIISATGYTGAGGFELYVHNNDLEALWHAVLKAGSEFEIKPIGLGARDTLRMEMGYCLYGNDIDDTTSPIHAGLSWITKLNKESDFNSKEKFKADKLDKESPRLAGFTVESRRVPRKGYEIYNEADKKIGTVTSGTLSPTLGQPIGLGYIAKPYNKSGSEIFIQIGKKKHLANVKKLPLI